MSRFAYIVMVILGIGLMVSAQSVLTEGVYDDTDSSIIYVGNFRTVTTSSAYSGSYVRTENTTDNSSVNFTFEGDSVALTVVRTTVGGAGDFCVNGVYCTSIDFLTDGITRYGVLYQISNLGPGQHTATLSRTQTGHMYLDRVDIGAPAPTPVVTNTPTPTPTPDTQVYYEFQDNDGNDISAVFEYRITAGDVMIAILLMPVLAFTSLMLINQSWSKR